MIFTDEKADTTRGGSSGSFAVTGSLQTVANLCASGSCPTVYVDNGTGSLIVQGFIVSAEQRGIDLPEGETLVEIPKELLAEALRNLS